MSGINDWMFGGGQGGGEGEEVEAFADPATLEAFFENEEGQGRFAWRTRIDSSSGQFSETFSMGSGWTWGDYYDLVRTFLTDSIPTDPSHRKSPNEASILSSRVGAGEVIDSADE